MANVYLQDSTLSAIGNAIRDKTGETGLLLPSEMAGKIEDIASGNDFKQKYALMQRVSANSREALTEAGLFTASATGFTLAIDFQALGYDSGEDFYNRGLQIQWLVKKHSSGGARRYGYSLFLLSPMFGLVDGKYLPVMDLTPNQYVTESSGVANGDPQISEYGIFAKPHYCIDITTGLAYTMSTSYAPGNSCYVYNRAPTSQEQLITEDRTVVTVGRLK